MTAVSKSLLQVRPELVGPDYCIYRYCDNYFKIVRFVSTAPHVPPPIRGDNSGYKHEVKLSPSLSRARRVCLELALCNEWKWFCTFTIAKDNFDRKNLRGYYPKFKEWLKYQAKKLGVSLPYVLVPEQHGDGSWHMHGFFSAAIDPLLVPFRQLKEEGLDVPYKLVKNDYYDCPSYRKKFGFCSFGLIRDHIACAHYTTKYISKSFEGDAQRVGLDLYYCSHKLNRASLYSEVYGRSSELDRYIQHEYEFCATGFVRIDRQPGDDPLLDIVESQQDQMQPFDYDSFCAKHYETQVVPEEDSCSDTFYQTMLEFFQ